jgi:uncharacterized protein YdhG (YjbR/CyaY superfamily)
MKSIQTVDEYISTFPEEVQQKLQIIRNIIKEISPDAVESISYGLPAYKLNKKPLIYFGGFTGHIGLYATPSAHETFHTELSPYKKGKGSVQFPLNKPLPEDLIAKMISFKVAEIIL